MHPTTLTAAQYAALRFLRTTEFLTDVGTLRGPTVVVLCSDGHQILEKIQYLESCTEHQGEPCQHIIATNGGALVLDAESPIARDVFDGVPVPMDACCLVNVLRGCRIKRPRTLILKTHFPCAMARTWSVGKALTHQARGYERVRRTVCRQLETEGVVIERITCHVHVNYGSYENPNGSKRTYAFDPADPRLADIESHIAHGSPER